MTSVVAVLAHQIGELKNAVDRSISELTIRVSKQGERIAGLEEYRIRAEEREKAEDRLRRALQEERRTRDEEDNTRVTLSFARWQVWFAAILALGAIVGAVVGILQIAS